MFTKIPVLPLARRLVAVACVLLVVVGSWSVDPAQAADNSDLAASDQKALAGYHLTLEKLNAFDAVNQKIAASMQTDPQLKKEIGSGILNVGTTLDDALGPFDSRAPHLAAVLKSANMSNRDYVLSVFSIIFAATGQAMKQAAPNEPLPPYIPADNVAVADKNGARFREVMNNMERLTAKARKRQASEEGTED